MPDFRAGKPICSGRTAVLEGANVNLDCETSYSGRDGVQLQWMNGDKAIVGTNFDAIRLAKQVVRFKATDELNGAPFVCQMNYRDDDIDDCTVILNVSCECL